MIHKTALIDSKAEIAENVIIGAFCVIGPYVKIEENTIIHSNVVVEGNTHIGKGCEIFPFTVIGTRAQDINISKEYIGNVKIGNDVIIREQVTVHSSTSTDNYTTIGDSCYLMATSHVAHDCILNKSVIMANSSMLAGYVEVGKNVFISGGAAVHQFSKIGDYSFIIASSRTVQDVPPYAMTAGSSPTEFAGINIVGLKRAGFGSEDIRLIKNAYRILFKKGMKTNDSFKELKQFSSDKVVQRIIDFITVSKRGIIKKWKGRNSL